MTHEAPQPQPEPQYEQLVLDFEAQPQEEQGAIYDWAKDNELAPTPEEVAQRDLSPHKIVMHGVKRALQDARNARQATKARKQADAAHESTPDTDIAEPAPASDDTTENKPVSAFEKVAREAKEGRFDGKSLKQRAAERISGRKTKKQDAVKNARIAQLEDELSGASSTILKRVKKLDSDGNVVKDSDGKIVWETERIKSMRTYQTDDQGKKRLMTNEQKIAYEQKVDELNTLRGYKPAEPQQTPVEAEPTQDMSEDEFTAFLNKLSDIETERIQKLMNENADLANKLNNMTNLQRKDIIISYLKGELDLSGVVNATTPTIDTVPQEQKGSWRDFAPNSELEPHDVKRFFENISADKLKQLEAYDADELDNYMDAWIAENPRDKAGPAITQDMFNEFIDSLSDEDYETFISIPEAEQNQWARDWFKDEKAPKVIVHPAGTTREGATRSFVFENGSKFQYPHSDDNGRGRGVPRLGTSSNGGPVVMDARGGLRHQTKQEKEAEAAKAKEQEQLAKAEAKKNKGPGFVRRAARATARGADKTLDALANRVGRYSIPKDQR